MECELVGNVELHETGQEKFYREIMAFHNLYREIELNGILIDKERRKELRKKYKEQDDGNEKELEGLLEYKINVNSPKQIAHLLYNELKLPLRKDTGEETLQALIVNVIKDEKKKKILELILRGRKIKKTIGTYLMAREDNDGRMRTHYNIVGTETGRTSTSKFKPPDRPGVYGLPFQTLTKHGDVGVDLRSMFIPDTNYTFLEADLSQAETRIVALLGRDEKALKAFEEGRDIHRLTASWIFGIAPEDINEEQRYLGKKVRHAGERGMEKGRLSQLANISQWKANQILTKFHSAAPNIEQVYFREIREALERDNLILISAYGRRRQFFERWSEELWKEAYAQIPQADVTDHLKFALLRIRARLKPPDFMILQESHDSFLAQVKLELLDEAAGISKEELEKSIDFSGCSLPRGMLKISCEIKTGMNWEEMRLYEPKRVSV